MRINESVSIVQFRVCTFSRIRALTPSSGCSARSKLPCRPRQLEDGIRPLRALDLHEWRGWILRAFWRRNEVRYFKDELTFSSRHLILKCTIPFVLQSLRFP